MKLKACPFCGAKAYRIPIDEDTPTWKAISCSAVCQCSDTHTCGSHKSWADAIRRWNTRKVDRAAIERALRENSRVEQGYTLVIEFTTDREVEKLANTIAEELEKGE